MELRIRNCMALGALFSVPIHVFTAIALFNLKYGVKLATAMITSGALASGVMALIIMLMLITRPEIIFGESR